MCLYIAQNINKCIYVYICRNAPFNTQMFNHQNYLCCDVGQKSSGAK